MTARAQQRRARSRWTSLLTRTQMMLAVCVLGANLFAARAQAYCQATTVQASLVCPSACVFDGKQVAWGTPEIEYAFNARGFPGIDEGALRAAIAAAFATWEGVTCGGVSLGFAFAPLALTTDLTVGPVESEPNLNVISWLNTSEWQQLGFGAQEFARTKVWYDEQTGEIVGADIAFNGAIMPLVVCPDSTSCDSEAVDLQNVATHELGHFLGLAHSEVPASTMWCAAQRGDHDKRTLDPDDQLGLCAAYQAGAGFLDHPPPSAQTPKPASSADKPAGCALVRGPAERASTSWWSLLPALALLLSARRARRPRVA